MRLPQDHQAEHDYMAEHFRRNAKYPDDAHPRLTQHMIAHLARFHGLHAEHVGNMGLVLLLSPHDYAHNRQDALGIEGASDQLREKMTRHREFLAKRDKGNLNRV
jgi:hypothetical protein